MSESPASSAAHAAAPDTPLLLSTLPPSRVQARACAGVALLLLIASLATIPFASVQLPHIDAFIPIVDTALVLGDVITASLLFALFSVQRSRALLILAPAHLFAGLIIVPHMLTFPGAFTESGLLGAGVNTTIWLYYFWHSGLPLAVIGYAWSRDAPGDTLASADTERAVRRSVAAMAAAVAALTLLTTAGHAWLPSMMS